MVHAAPAMVALVLAAAVEAGARAHPAATLLATAEGLHVTLPGDLALALKTHLTLIKAVVHLGDGKENLHFSYNNIA